MEQNEHTQSGVAQAIAKAGSQVRLGIALGVKQQAISLWLKQGFVPRERAKEIEQLYGIPRAILLDPKLADLVGLPNENADI